MTLATGPPSSSYPESISSSPKEVQSQRDISNTVLPPPKEGLARVATIQSANATVDASNAELPDVTVNPQPLPTVAQELQHFDESNSTREMTNGNSMPAELSGRCIQSFFFSSTDSDFA